MSGARHPSIINRSPARLILLLAGLVLILFAASCATATQAPEAVVETVEVVKEGEETRLPAAEETEGPAAEPVQASPTSQPTPIPPSATRPVEEVQTPIPQTPIGVVTQPPVTLPTALEETRLLELEWPASMRLGDSDVIRLSLLPYKDGYVVQAEFPEHETQSQKLKVPRPGGYDVYALARLDGVGFEISPAGDQEQYLAEDQPATWRWSLSPRRPGQQRLNLRLRLRWQMPPGAPAAGLHEQEVFSRSLETYVISLIGMTRPQALAAGLFSLLFGAGLAVAALLVYPASRSRSAHLSIQPPNANLVIEPNSGLTLSEGESVLLKTLFRQYARLVLEKEYRSGYSGARTFLALPVLADGQADAYTIAKLGEQQAIQREYENYGAFVKYRLPPVTARIQDVPVAAPPPKTERSQDLPVYRLAGLRYTFIGESGAQPASLREILLADPDPAYLNKLFETFGPSWWMQRRPYSFRLGLEYDRMLPTHLVIAPADGRGRLLDSRQSPFGLEIGIGELVRLHGFQVSEVRSDGRSLSLLGQPPAGEPPLRIRWLGLQPPQDAIGRITATRRSLLGDFVQGFNLFGLPDSLTRLPSLLNQTISATRSTIHGDLNLENILLGPGGLIWLIDFAQTREGHTLVDFAHLHAEIIAHIISTHVDAGPDFINILRGSPAAEHSTAYLLHQVMLNIAAKCLFNPGQPGEYLQALSLACLGALKFTNLSSPQKHLLFLTAAYFAQPD